LLCIVMYYWYDVINANKMIHNELVLLVCFSTVDNMNLLIWSNPIHYKKIHAISYFHNWITLLVYQYCTKFLKKFTILEQIFILVIAKYRRSFLNLIFISHQISLIFLLFLIPYIIIIIRANGPIFALCHAWLSRCEIIYWF
jgi:hypothetical protein